MGTSDTNRSSEVDSSTHITAISQTKAAWAAVRESKKMVRAAWYSVVLNVIIVFSVFTIPYLQRRAAAEITQREKLFDKINLIYNMKIDYNSTLEWIDAEQARVVRLNGNLSDDEKAEEIYRLEVMEHYDQSEIDGKIQQYKKVAEDAFNASLLAGYLEADRNTLFANKSTIDYMRMFPRASSKELANHRMTFIKMVAVSARTERLLIELNESSDGKVLAEPHFGRCSVLGLTPVCSKRLTYIVQRD